MKSGVKKTPLPTRIFYEDGTEVTQEDLEVYFQKSGPPQMKRPDRNKSSSSGSKPGKNPLDKFGKRMECHVCKSLDHLKAECPKNKTSETYLVETLGESSGSDLPDF